MSRARFKTQRIVWALEHEIDEWIAAKRTAFQNQLEADPWLVAKRSELAAAEAREVEENREAEDLAIKKALARKDLPVPLGTTLHEWAGGGWGNPVHQTGRTGVLEVVTRESRYATNLSRPALASIVIRINKKDGRPGLVYESVTRHNGIALDRWHPADWRPKTKPSKP